MGRLNYKEQKVRKTMKRMSGNAVGINAISMQAWGYLGRYGNGSFNKIFNI